MQVFVFIKLSTKTYLTGIFDLNDTEGEQRVRQMEFMFCDLHVSLNNPSSGDINSSNLSCSFQRVNNKGADQSAHMLRLICAFGISMQQNQVFLQ